MDYTNAMMVWDAVSVRITDVRHGAIAGGQSELTGENGLFIFVLGKDVRVTIEDVPYAPRGDALFHVGRGRRVRLDTTGKVEYHCVAYHAEAPQAVGREMARLLWEEAPFDATIAVRPVDITAVLRSCEALESAWKEAPPLGHLHAKAAFYALLAEFYAALSQSERSVAVDAVAWTQQYLRLHLSEDISILMLAKALGISRSSLHEQFSRRMGISPQQYLTNLRLEAAHRALRESESSIQEIIAACGLRDKNHFYNLYRQRFGMTPGEYRKQFPVRKKETNIPDASKPARSGVLIENFGRIHHYAKTPQRIVCLDYAAAEICAALGAGARIVGVAEAETCLSDCAQEYRKVIAAATFLPGASADHRVPSYAAVRACGADLVVGTAYAFHDSTGVADAAAFERDGMHIYAMRATYKLNGTFEDTYEDIFALGKILDCETRAAALVETMRVREAALNGMRAAMKEPPRVFVFDSQIVQRAFTCGQSLENGMIQAAGGRNIFADRTRMFVPVAWEDVARADPEVIIVHRFNSNEDGEQKMALLYRRPELAQVAAIRNGQIHVISVKSVFPALDNVDAALQMAAWFQECPKN